LVFLIILVLSSQSIALCEAHIKEKVEEWIDKNKNIKIQFDYSPEKPIIDTFTELQFSVQDLETKQHLKDFDARVVVTNGDFSIKYIFPDDGTHKVLLRVNTNNSIVLASFSVFVPHQSPPSLLNPFPNNQGQPYTVGQWISITIIIVIPIAVLFSVILIIKKKV